MRKLSTLILACVIAMSTMPTTACTVDQVLADINVAIQIAGQITQAVGAVSPADATIIAGLSGTASGVLRAAQDYYKAYESSGAVTDLQKVEAALDAGKATLKEAIAAAHVTNPASAAKVVAWYNLLYTSLDAVLEALPQTGNAKSMAKGSRTLTPALTPQGLQARWVTEVCQGEARCASLVKVPRRKLLGIL